MSIPDPAPTQVYNFDRVAAEYEATRYMPDHIAERVAQQITQNLVPNDWLLEAGIGTGRIGRALLRQHPRTIGIDISHAMLGYLRTAYGGSENALPLALADVRALPFPDNSFETVVAVHVLHLIPEWERALGELWRVLPVGGKLVLGVEDRTTSAIRDYFFARAAEQNALPTTRSGAHSSQVIAALRLQNVPVQERRLSALSWTQLITAAQTLDQLARRTYSILWQMPDEKLTPLMEATRSWATQQYGTADMGRIRETIDFQMVLFFATKQTTQKR